MQVKGVPKFVSPMTTQVARKAFDSPEWIFEIKLDGY
jgi:ATP-dependent DNA ligase